MFEQITPQIVKFQDSYLDLNAITYLGKAQKYVYPSGREDMQAEVGLLGKANFFSFAKEISEVKEEEIFKEEWEKLRNAFESYQRIDHVLYDIVKEIAIKPEVESLLKQWKMFEGINKSFDLMIMAENKKNHHQS